MKEALINLLKIKSIVTIVTTAVFAVLLLMGRAIPQEFMLIYTAVIAFYFGTQTMRASYNESKTSDLPLDNTNS